MVGMIEASKGIYELHHNSPAVDKASITPPSSPGDTRAATDMAAAVRTCSSGDRQWGCGAGILVHSGFPTGGDTN